MGLFAAFRLASCMSVSSQLVGKVLKGEVLPSGMAPDKLVTAVVEALGIAQQSKVPNSWLLSGAALAHAIQLCNKHQAAGLGDKLFSSLGTLFQLPAFKRELDRASETGGINLELTDLIFSVFDPTPLHPVLAQEMRLMQEELSREQDGLPFDLLNVRPGKD